MISEKEVWCQMMPTILARANANSLKDLVILLSKDDEKKWDLQCFYTMMKCYKLVQASLFQSSMTVNNLEHKERSKIPEGSRQK